MLVLGGAWPLGQAPVGACPVTSWPVAARRTRGPDASCAGRRTLPDAACRHPPHLPLDRPAPGGCGRYTSGSTSTVVIAGFGFRKSQTAQRIMPTPTLTSRSPVKPTLLGVVAGHQLPAGQCHRHLVRAHGRRVGHRHTHLGRDALRGDQNDPGGPVGTARADRDHAGVDQGAGRRDQERGSSRDEDAGNEPASDCPHAALGLVVLGRLALVAERALADVVLGESAAHVVASRLLLRLYRPILVRMRARARTYRVRGVQHATATSPATDLVQRASTDARGPCASAAAAPPG